MSEVNAVKKKTLGDRFAEFKAMEGADKRRVISGALINNAMYIIIAIAVISLPSRCRHSSGYRPSSTSFR